MATSNIKLLCLNISKMRIGSFIINRSHSMKPRYRPPYWYEQKERVITEDFLTKDNEDFLQEILQDRLQKLPTQDSPLILDQVDQTVQWNQYTRRTGLIARKIGNYPMWTKDGKRMLTTLLQVNDNHVIKYIPPDEFNPMIIKNKKWKENKRLGCLLVGSENIDPSMVTKQYCGLFNTIGMLPKRHLYRFMVSPESALPPGTPLFATHFRVGDHIDVRAKTIDRGFQGVMKRWGFKGMPASHGVTKTHRRPGNIGSGGEKARVWPGTKMPGHMGNRWRVLRGVKILRIDTKYNVLWTLGVAIPGETGATCYLYDTVLPLKKHKSSPPFPTHGTKEDLPPEFYDEIVHRFEQPSITFEED
ncbi:hypothetical protein K1T71_002712 [Dendrolimus kikuchii]|uniref:Uncharacterized protein n=1 Tax=Dendrolimus kikuchii TaxID=765133 RepID=A0ACC1DDW2_9NEOP|nr:hypothetical protein K1T71_002712 [Dendrolimus kikuchii]